MIRGRVLITGGSGTLGHAIVRTALNEGWDAEFTIFSRSEYLQSQMRALYPYNRYILGDVADYNRLEAAIAGHDLVIHAAAMKRIPECEYQPAQCYQTNVIGALNVVRACTTHRVKRCVGISTDKACKAITAYGASKLAMEKLFQAQTEIQPIFTLVRYGNVVASRGSVIPLWRKQAEDGRPITITDKRATRFWMSELDAVELIQLATDLYSGQIIVPKMKALPILDMARIIAPRSSIVETGFRSIEKMHEDLVSMDEGSLDHATHYVIAPSANGRVSYTSKNAPKMTEEEFLSMIAVAEKAEEIRQ